MFQTYFKCDSQLKLKQKCVKEHKQLKWYHKAYLKRQIKLTKILLK